LNEIRRFVLLDLPDSTGIQSIRGGFSNFELRSETKTLKKVSFFIEKAEKTIKKFIFSIEKVLSSIKNKTKTIKSTAIFTENGSKTRYSRPMCNIKPDLVTIDRPTGHFEKFVVLSTKFDIIWNAI